ncbi:threonine synthase [Salsipaludibacter albus]|uniref:threonine synthase n=1 Tax=Salsipaludibacter albus TaxID=2849650 RepID=UPI001EE3C79F|nr:threonine synthase [Salsipaludibacter albus]MBY5163681.1 threonine synthase [Salsipaludibacter albus]
MQYVSTRGRAEPTDFFGALMTGLAHDGGLYVPDEWPTLSPDLIRSLRSMPYSQAAWEVMRPFVHGGSAGDAGDRGISDATLHTLLDEAYASFVHHSVAPLFQTGPDEWLLELYHGPTLAFKDVAMQVLGRMYEHVLRFHDRHITLIGATSGDTGSAAIEAVRRSTRSSIFIMHPHGRTTEVQRRQMTTVQAPNVHNIAIEGTFDDCQRILKELFNDGQFRDEVALSGVNSINWARVLPQVVYYATAASSLGAPDVEVSFSVPTGNFGDIFAGYVARQIGVPIRRLVIATNDNDILARFLATGRHELEDVTPTISPSMDIQVSSNFERLLFDIHGRDGDRVTADMEALARDGVFTVDEALLDDVRSLFGAHRADEAQTLAAIRAVFDETGFQVDPHTAVGFHAAREDRQGRPDPGVPMVVLGPAHPAKFPTAVERATGVRPALPPHLSDLYDREERLAVLPADLATVRDHIRAKLART